MSKTPAMSCTTNGIAYASNLPLFSREISPRFPAPPLLAGGDDPAVHREDSAPANRHRFSTHICCMLKQMSGELVRGEEVSERSLQRFEYSFDRSLQIGVQSPCWKALVTGANSGIGRAVALALGQAGADVVVNYVVGEDAAEDVVQQLKEI